MNDKILFNHFVLKFDIQLLDFENSVRENFSRSVLRWTLQGRIIEKKTPEYFVR